VGDDVDVKVPAKRGQKGPFPFGTGLVNQLLVQVTTGFVLDVEDEHFNNDRAVLLPELSSDDGSTPVLDERRITGLGVIYAALVHADKNPSQKLFVTGHTDPSGTAAYNQTLSEKRAENVSLLLRGDREKWRKQASKNGRVDDYQTILKWQHQRAGWDCDPGPVSGKLTAQTTRAIGRFQELYNDEVDAAQNDGKDSPFKKKIATDKAVGGETWGAFYDVYMTELMDLLELENFSDLEQRQQKLQAPAGMPDFVGCGEHIPFDPELRNNPEDGNEERTEGPAHDRSDRRVELLFFDPGEQVQLDCHPKPGKCKPQLCPIYKKHEFDFDPIEVPKGLEIAEANIKLTFVDPEGKTRAFPEGLEVEVKFGDPKDFPPEDDELDEVSPDGIIDPNLDDDSDDASDGAGANGAGANGAAAQGADGEDEVDQEPNVTTDADGVVRFVIPRKAASIFLRILPGKMRFITADPKDVDDQELADLAGAKAAAAKGRFFFRIPKEFNTLDGFWKGPDGVDFQDGKFLDIDNRQTKIGSRDSPAEMKLDIQWQFFRFEYFDRWTNSMTVVPQGHAPKDDAQATFPVLSMKGHNALLDPGAPDTQQADAHTLWSLGTGKDTVHCLAWVRRGKDASAANGLREVPDDKSMARVRFDAPTFVRTEGDGKSPDAERNLVTSDKQAADPSADRLRLYDLPNDWWSTDYPVRFAGETVDKVQPFQKAVATKSAAAKPYVVSLDTIVLHNDTGDGADTRAVWDDSKIDNRVGIYDNDLQVYQPDKTSGEIYFTELAKLKKKPDGPVLHDFPPFTRLITRGQVLFDVFNARTRRGAGFKGFPIGARLAERYSVGDAGSAFLKSSSLYRAPRPNGSNGSSLAIGSDITALLRCCGHDGNVELFKVFQYSSVFFDFKPAPDTKNNGVPLGAAAPANPDQAARDCLIKVNQRWNGEDSVHSDKVIFHVGKPETARGRWHCLLARGAQTGSNQALVTVSIYKKGLRAFMRIDERTTSPVGEWAIQDMAPEGAGWFTAAHELGHGHSLPDEYLNTDDEPSLDEPNIVEASRSPGTPYGLDPRAIMVTNRKVRTRNFWHLVSWFRDGLVHFGETDEISIEHGPTTFQAAITLRAQNPVQFPKTSDLNASIGAVGLCDRFLYLIGHDGWTAQDMDKSSAASPYDGFIMVRVKMGWTFTTTSDFHSIRSLMSRAHAAIQSNFNADRKLALRGTADGKAVRLRVLFAPRFICQTFPTGTDSAKYLAGLDPPLPTAAAYTAQIGVRLANPGVHADIRVVKDGTPGVTAGAAPRAAVVRQDSKVLLVFPGVDFDDDVVRVFSQLVGLKDEKVGSPNDFRPAVSNLGSLVVSSLEFVPV
jgi:hypothetical protein